jgi:hypothetical protein
METYNMSKTHNIHLIATLASDDMIYTHNTRDENFVGILSIKR